MEVPFPAEAPVTPVCVSVHEKVAPVTSLVNTIELVFPEQIDCEEGVIVKDGIGLTVMVTTIGVPEQEAEVGVIM